MNEEERERTKEFLAILGEISEEDFNVKISVIPFSAKDVVSKSDFGFLLECCFKKENKDCPFIEMIVEFIILEIKRTSGTKKHFGIYYNPCKTSYIKNPDVKEYSNKVAIVEGMKLTGYLPEFSGTFSFAFLDYMWRFINYSLSRFSQTIEKHSSPDCDFKDYTSEEAKRFNTSYEKCVRRVVEKRIKKQVKKEFGVDL